MEYRLEDICIKVTDGSHFSPKDDANSSIPMLSVKDMKEFDFDYTNCKHISLEDYKKMLRQDCVPKKYDVLVAKDGSYLKEIFVNEKENEKALLSSIAIFRPNIKIVDPYFLCYLLKIPAIMKYTKENCVSGSALPRIILKAFKDIKLDIPEMGIQRKIVNIIKKINQKIILNNEMNDNLLEIIDNVYKNEFLDLEKFDKAENIANITIGKTPPRSISECFTQNDSDIKWVSISDLGKCGIYINDTSEKLTKDAVDKYNVKIIPEETVILSFKLTVGRVAITRDKMATNEAIAHFNLNNKDMKYFIYCYLKNFDFGSLGSTSSIATAVNSKIIKSMPIGNPNNEKLIKFNNTVKTLFEKIKNNEIENETLIRLRDILLPKLMNGEIDLDKIEI